MDSNKLNKRPPPVPKFNTAPKQQIIKDNDLQKKLDSFFTEVSKEANIQKQSQSLPKQIQTKKQISNQKDDNNNLPLVDKKKLTLANMNSKLNNMLTSKKINLNLGASKSTDTPKPVQLNPQKVQKKRSQIATEYDPLHPNNYDLSRNYYTQKFAQLDRDSEQQMQQKIINTTGIGLQRLSQQMQQQAPLIIQQQVLQQKQQIALRMMQKFGYKVGTGLGKQAQGITTPLTIKKTTDNSCIIQQSNIPLNHLIRPEVSAKNALIAHNVEISQVIIFVNLLKIEQLGQQVEKQLKQECVNFGQLKNWQVFLLKDNQGSVQLRIFAQFNKKQQAFNMFVGLNNRYYNGNLASLRFYPKQQFVQGKLGAKLHDHIET